MGLIVRNEVETTFLLQRLDTRRRVDDNSPSPWDVVDTAEVYPEAEKESAVIQLNSFRELYQKHHPDRFQFRLVERRAVIEEMVLGD